MTDIGAPNSHASPPPPLVSANETPEIQDLFETARRALRGVGFRGKETSRAIDVMRESTPAT